MTQPAAVLSVDFERFSHLPAYRQAAGTAPGADAGPAAMDRLLDSLAAHDADATFFVVSEIAEGHPDVVAAAADAGHEVGSHTRGHVHLSEVGEDRRRAELVESRRTLERVTGADVTGFRAPSFDVADGHFQAVAEAGYGYDSSVVACRSIPGFYGGEWSARRPCRAADVTDGLAVGDGAAGVDDVPAAGDAAVADDGTTADDDVVADLGVLPVAVMPGLRLPLTGAWLRLFGVNYALLGMGLLARQGIPPVLYVHPWEFLDLPAVEGVPRRVYVRTGDWMWRALDRILSVDFEFVTARSLVPDG